MRLSAAVCLSVCVLFMDADVMPGVCACNVLVTPLSCGSHDFMSLLRSVCVKHL